MRLRSPVRFRIPLAASHRQEERIGSGFAIDINLKLFPQLFDQRDPGRRSLCISAASNFFQLREDIKVYDLFLIRSNRDQQRVANQSFQQLQVGLVVIFVSGIVQSFRSTQQTTSGRP